MSRRLKRQVLFEVVVMEDHDKEYVAATGRAEGYGATVGAALADLGERLDFESDMEDLLDE
jgi:hypothetical protein